MVMEYTPRYSLWRGDYTHRILHTGLNNWLHMISVKQAGALRYEASQENLPQCLHEMVFGSTDLCVPQQKFIRSEQCWWALLFSALSWQKRKPGHIDLYHMVHSQMLFCSSHLYRVIFWALQGHAVQTLKSGRSSAATQTSGRDNHTPWLKPRTLHVPMHGTDDEVIAYRAGRYIHKWSLSW